MYPLLTKLAAELAYVEQYDSDPQLCTDPARLAAAEAALQADPTLGYELLAGRPAEPGSKLEVVCNAWLD